MMMTKNTSGGAVLVVGATGQIGGLVVNDLAARGVPVRAFVREGTQVGNLVARGIEVAVGDLAQPETLDAALVGVRAAFLLSPSAPNQVALQCAFVDAAHRAGLKRLVKLSGAHASEHALGVFPRWHGEIEAYIRASGLSFTFVQPVYFMQNIPTQIRSAHDRFVAPVSPTLAVSLVDARDIASVSAAVLREDGHEGQTYVVTGPALLTHNEIAETIGRVAGLTLAFEQIGADVFVERLLRAGQPEWLARGVAELFTYMDTDLTGVVAMVTGHAPFSFETFVQDNVAAFHSA